MNIKGNLQQLHNPQLENTRQLHLIATTTAVTLQKYSIDLCIYNGKNKHTNNNSLFVATNADTFQILLIIIFKLWTVIITAAVQTINTLCIILTIMY